MESGGLLTFLQLYVFLLAGFVGFFTITCPRSSASSP
jgi:hypothetical protein